MATFTPKSIGLEHSFGYTVTEVFENKFIQNAMPNEYITVRVVTSGEFLKTLDNFVYFVLSKYMIMIVCVIIKRCSVSEV